MKKGNQALLDHSRVSKEVSSFMDDRIQWLREMFPEIFSEGMVDLEKMRAALGSSDEKAERYAFTWAGKEKETQFRFYKCQRGLHSFLLGMSQ